MDSYVNLNQRYSQPIVFYKEASEDVLPKMVQEFKNYMIENGEQPYEICESMIEMLFYKLSPKPEWTLDRYTKLDLWNSMMIEFCPHVLSFSIQQEPDIIQLLDEIDDNKNYIFGFCYHQSTSPCYTIRMSNQNKLAMLRIAL
jgi:hypothetical protein